MFDITAPDGAKYHESAAMKPGDAVVTYDCEGVTVGCAICYDVRFPEMFYQLRKAGAELIFLPSAFTLQTGKDHWEPLIKARAIETQCYIAAAATHALDHHVHRLYEDHARMQRLARVLHGLPGLAFEAPQTNIIFCDVDKDIAARFVAVRLTEGFNQSAVVDNRPGAGSTLGTDLVAKSVPDGYTLLVTHNAIAINQTLYSKLPYDADRDLRPITNLYYILTGVFVKSAVPVNSMQELQAYAKAKPGVLNTGTFGPRSSLDMSRLFLGDQWNTTITGIPYPGGPQIFNALAAMVPRALKAAETLAAEHGISATVIDLRCLVPLDTKTILAHSARTGSRSRSLDSARAPPTTTDAGSTTVTRLAMAMAR